MDIPKIHEGEYRFCLIMWEHEPVTAAELVKLCQEQLGWKRTTTYTVIKRLGEKGVLQNDNGTITSLVSKDAVQAYEIGELVEKTFEGSLPAFVAAFTKHQNISVKLSCVESMDAFHIGQVIVYQILSVHSLVLSLMIFQTIFRGHFSYIRLIKVMNRFYMLTMKC